MDDDPIDAECSNESCVNVKDNLKMLVRTTQKQASDLLAYSQISSEADILRMKLLETEKVAQSAIERATDAVNAKEIAEAELKQIQSSSEFHRKKILQLEEEADEAHVHKQQANSWREKYDSICALAEKLESNNIEVKAKYESAVQAAKLLAKQLKPLQNQAAKVITVKQKDPVPNVVKKYLKSAIQVIDALSNTANLSKQSKSIKDQVQIFRRDDVRLHFNSLPWKNSSGRTAQDEPEDQPPVRTEEVDDAEPANFEPQDNLLNGGRSLSDDEDEEVDEGEDDPEIQALERDLTEDIVKSTRKTRSQQPARPDFAPKMRELNARKVAPRIIETKKVKNWPQPVQKPTAVKSGGFQGKHGLLDPSKIHAVHVPVTAFEAISQATERRKGVLLGTGKPEEASGSGTSIHGRKGKTVRELQSEMMKGESVKEKVARMKARELAKNGKQVEPVKPVEPAERVEAEVPENLEFELPAEPEPAPFVPPAPPQTIPKAPLPPTTPSKAPKATRHQSFCLSEATDSGEEDEPAPRITRSRASSSMRGRSRSVSRCSEASRRSGRVASKPDKKPVQPSLTLRRSTRILSRPASRAVSRKNSPEREAESGDKDQSMIAQAAARAQRARNRSCIRGDLDDDEESVEQEPKTPNRRERKESESGSDEDEELDLTRGVRQSLRDQSVGEVLRRRFNSGSGPALTRKRAAPAPLDAGPPTRVKGTMAKVAPKKKEQVAEAPEEQQQDSQDTVEFDEPQRFDDTQESEDVAPKRIAHAAVVAEISPDFSVLMNRENATSTPDALENDIESQEPPQLPAEVSPEQSIDDNQAEPPILTPHDSIEEAPEAVVAPEIAPEPETQTPEVAEVSEPIKHSEPIFKNLCAPPPSTLRPQTPKSPKQIIASQFGLDISDSEEEEDVEEPPATAAPEAPTSIVESPKEPEVEKPADDVDLMSDSESDSDSEASDQLQIRDSAEEDEVTPSAPAVKKQERPVEFENIPDPTISVLEEAVEEESAEEAPIPEEPEDDPQPVLSVEHVKEPTAIEAPVQQATPEPAVPAQETVPTAAVPLSKPEAQSPRLPPKRAAPEAEKFEPPTRRAPISKPPATSTAPAQKAAPAPAALIPKPLQQRATPVSMTAPIPTSEAEKSERSKRKTPIPKPLPTQAAPVLKPTASAEVPAVAAPKIFPKIIAPPERKEAPKPRRAPIASLPRPLIPAPVRMSSSEATDDDLSFDILAGAKMSKPARKPPVKRPVPVASSTAESSTEPAPKRAVSVKQTTQPRVTRASSSTTSATKAVRKKPEPSLKVKAETAEVPKDLVLSEDPEDLEEPEVDDTAPTTSTAAAKKGGAILIEARHRGRARKIEVAPKPISIKEMGAKKTAKVLSTARGHLRQALDLKLGISELKRPLEERGIILGDSIPLHPSDAADVMMEYLRETSAADMWAVVKKQRTDGNLSPLMNIDEENFLQVCTSLNSDHELLLELFVGRILSELCRRDTLDSKQCGRYTRLFCHSVKFAQKDEEQSVEWMRRFVLILLNKHEHQLIKAVAYCLISDVAEHCRWLVEDIDEPSAFATAFKVLMHSDSEQAAVINWLVNSKFQYPYIPAPTNDDVQKAFLAAHQKFLSADDVTLDVTTPSVYLAKTGAAVVLTVAFGKLKEQMTKLEKQFLEPHDKEKEIKHKSVFSIPSISTKLTEEEALALKRELEWQKCVLMIMVGNPLGNNWNSIINALIEISPKIVELRELLETPDAPEQFAELSAIDPIRSAVDQLSQLISEFTSYPLTPTVIPVTDSALD